LQELGLDHAQVGDAGVAALAASPHLGRLQALDLGNNPITDEGVEALARSETLKRLTHLTVSREGLADAPISEGALQRLRHAPNLPRLISLTVL
jgi:hypothetical protein